MWPQPRQWCCREGSETATRHVSVSLTRRRTRLKGRLQARQSGLVSSASHGALMSWINLRTCGRIAGMISSYDLPWQPWLMVSITQLSLPSRNSCKGTNALGRIHRVNVSLYLLRPTWWRSAWGLRWARDCSTRCALGPCRWRSRTCAWLWSARSARNSWAWRRAIWSSGPHSSSWLSVVRSANWLRDWVHRRDVWWTYLDSRVCCSTPLRWKCVSDTCQQTTWEASVRTFWHFAFYVECQARRIQVQLLFVVVHHPFNVLIWKWALIDHVLGYIPNRYSLVIWRQLMDSLSCTFHPAKVRWELIPNMEVRDFKVPLARRARCKIEWNRSLISAE